MYHYTSVQWIFVFCFYCFFGWCFESAYVSLRKRRFVNRGFLRGPFLPIYGSGAVMMLVVSEPFKDNLFLVFLAGCVGATVLEYVTGVVMESLFQVRYWDYSDQPLNFQGHICLSSTLAWGGLTVAMNLWIHPPIHELVARIPSEALTITTFMIGAFICADFALSFKAAMDLRRVLEAMERAKTEMAHLQKRLDVVLALAGEELSQRSESLAAELGKRTEAFSEGLETRMEDIKRAMDASREKLGELKNRKASEYVENVVEEAKELIQKYARALEDRESLGRIRDFYQKSLIRANPTMYSRRFKDALEELKRRAAARYVADTEKEADGEKETGAGNEADTKKGLTRKKAPETDGEDVNLK